jgi:type II secretory pathway component PulF
VATIGEARQAITYCAAKAELYRAWRAGHRMGATHPHALEMIEIHADPAAEAFRGRLLAGTRRGRTVASLVNENTLIAEPFERAVLVAGEESGTLEQSLASLATHFSDEHRFLLKVWSKLTYPLLLSAAFIVIGPVPLLFMGAQRRYVLIVLIGLGVWYGFGGTAIRALAERYATKSGRVTARLARTLAAAVESGLSLDRAVALAADVTGQRDIIAHIRAISAPRLATQPASESFRDCPGIPPQLLAAMRIAETTGDFTGSLRRLADLYDA